MTIFDKAKVTSPGKKGGALPKRPEVTGKVPVPKKTLTVPRPELMGSEQRAQTESLVSSDTGFIVLKPGDFIQRYPIPKAKFSESRVEKLSIIKEEIFAVKYHYFDGMGYVYCVGTVCCKADAIPPVRYILPVFRFSTLPKGDLVTPINGNVELLPLSEDDYHLLMDLWAVNESLLDKTLEIKCKDAQYQKISMSIISSDPFGGDEELRETAIQYYELHRASIKSSIARTVSEQDLADFLDMEIDTNYDEKEFFAG